MMVKPYPAWHLFSGRRYVPALLTNVAETFKRVRQEQKQVVVVQINARKK